MPFLMTDQTLPPHLKAFAEREFLGEQMIWAEKQDQKIAAFLSFGIWLFAIPWTAFALFWESMVVGPLVLELLGYEIGNKQAGTGIRAGMWAMGLFGIPFIVVGFGMLAAPFFALRKAGQTLYVLTNKRLAILEGGKTISVTSVSPGEILSTSRKEGPDGRGTLILHQGFTKDSDGDRVEKKTDLGVIADVRRIEQTVQGWMAKAAKA
jgi:hypothetical protein